MVRIIGESSRDARDGRMSAEYVMKMEALRRSREELTAKRQEIERRIALREATAAEYSAIALQSAKQKWKNLRASAIAAKRRNDEFIREVHETKRKVEEAYLRTTQKLWPSDNQLEIEKARYLRKVEEMYPAWQEKMQAIRVQTLRELEEKKRAIEKRRYLAKKTFETERTLDDLIQQTSHEIGLAENMERNEALERELLRSQSAVQAMRLDESIRDHAAGARMYMARQAAEQLSSAQRVQPDVENQIFDTFSPRRAVKTIREANESIAILGTEKGDNSDDDSERPRHSQKIRVPTQYHSKRGAVNNPLPDPYLKTADYCYSRDLHEGGKVGPAARARSEVLFAKDQPTVVPEYPSTPRIQTTGTNIRPDPSSISEQQTSYAPAIHGVRHDTLPEAPTTATVHASVYSPSPPHLTELTDPSHRLLSEKGTQNTFDISGANAADRHEAVLPLPVAAGKENSCGDAFSLTEAFDTLASTIASPHITQPPLTTYDTHADEITPTSKQQTTLVVTNEAPESQRVSTAENGSIEANPTIFSEQTDSPPVDEVREAFTSDHNTHTHVEVAQNFSRDVPMMVVKREDKSSASFDSESTLVSPTKSELNETAADLKINLITSFDSNQSSVMDFSIDKLLATPPRGSNALFPDTPEIKDFALSQSQTTFVGPEAKPSESVDTLLDETVAPLPIQSQMPDEEGMSWLPSEPAVSPAFSQHDQGVVAHSKVLFPASVESLVLSSLESVSELGSPTTMNGGDLKIELNSEMGSPALETSMPISETETVQIVENPPTQTVSAPAPPNIEEQKLSHTSLFTTISMPERLKALTTLIARVEEGISDGEQVGGITGSDCSFDTKRDLLRMAVSGRKAQINFFGSDVCFDLVIDLARELGPVLFPAKAFEGILNEPKMKKVHQNSKEKEGDMWKAFSAHIKQLHTTKALQIGPLVETFTSAFLSADPSNQRSQRKLRELLYGVCGASENTPKKESAPASLQQDTSAAKGPLQAESPRDREVSTTPPIPNILQTAFLQTSSPPKAKTYGIASTSFKKSSSDDVLKSMASSPTKLSQKLMRGGKIGDYSEFEEEDEVDLENLIGSKGSTASATPRTNSNSTKTNPSVRGGQRLHAMREDKDEFDVDF